MNDDDGAVDLIVGFVVARRAQQFLGRKDETLELAIALAVKETLGVIQNAEGNLLAALDEWFELEEMVQ